MFSLNCDFSIDSYLFPIWNKFYISIFAIFGKNSILNLLKDSKAQNFDFFATWLMWSQIDLLTSKNCSFQTRTNRDLKCSPFLSNIRLSSCTMFWFDWLSTLELLLQKITTRKLRQSWIWNFHHLEEAFVSKAVQKFINTKILFRIYFQRSKSGAQNIHFKARKWITGKQIQKEKNVFNAFCQEGIGSTVLP